ncbi:hypothetical protein [Nonomuraea sp. NPDC049646]|uniref:hypothetical protein n=1 Tax=unclassified Nonomuraea TaxID=2593643 RepID=UPI0037AE6DC0
MTVPSGSLHLDTGHTSPDDSPGTRTGDIEVEAFGFNVGPKLVNGATAAGFAGTGRLTLHTCRSTGPAEIRVKPAMSRS